LWGAALILFVTPHPFPWPFPVSVRSENVNTNSPTYLSFHNFLLLTLLLPLLDLFIYEMTTLREEEVYEPPARVKEGAYFNDALHYQKVLLIGVVDF
jgi:hypothetical protein